MRVSLRMRLGLAAVLVSMAGAVSLGAAAQAGASDRVAGPLSPTAGAYFGASSENHGADLNDAQWQTYVQAREAKIGRHWDVINYFPGWTPPLGGTRVKWMLSQGIIPMISWDSPTTVTDQQITDGAQDAVITAQALSLKSLNAPVFLRFDWEFNGSWFAWDGSHNNDPGTMDGPAKYVAMWRHVHDIFSAVGATNVVWVWTALAVDDPVVDWNHWTNYYPGDDYVDWASVDSYNWADKPGGYPTWTEFAPKLAAFYGDFAGRKPIVVAETAAGEDKGHDKGQWITNMRNALEVQYPDVQAVDWFDINQQNDWRFDTSASSLAAYKAMGADPYFKQPHNLPVMTPTAAAPTTIAAPATTAAATTTDPAPAPSVVVTRDPVAPSGAPTTEPASPLPSAPAPSISPTDTSTASPTTDPVPTNAPPSSPATTDPATPSPTPTTAVPTPTPTPAPTLSTTPPPTTTPSASPTSTTTTAAPTATSKAPTATPTPTATATPTAGGTLSISSSATRGSPKGLSGATVGSSAYVFATFGGAPTKVTFFVDNVLRTGTPYSTDTAAPYDLAGGSSTKANPFNGTALLVGQHTMTALAAYANGTSTAAYAVFTVGAGPSPSLIDAEVSVNANRSSPIAFSGATLKGSVYPFVKISGTVTSVAFYVDDPSAKKAALTTETKAPYDLVAGGTTAAAKPYNTATLSKGEHSLTIVAKVTGVGTINRTALFVVQ
ncbi:hypothetical protein acdb102_47670 [Acidothermaceae bacterium B102]|nr:hypothetical protein acdb102_47670 [Acidothermaceae bacterium B102]